MCDRKDNKADSDIESYYVHTQASTKKLTLAEHMYPVNFFNLLSPHDT
jgi:hypothetical protein